MPSTIPWYRRNGAAGLSIARKGLPLPARGLLSTMLDAAWEDGPLELSRLHMICGCSVAEVRRFWPMVAELSAEIVPTDDQPGPPGPLWIEVPDRPGWVLSPPIEALRARCSQRSAIARLAGGVGAAKRWNSLKAPVADAMADAMATPLATPVATPMTRREEKRREEDRDLSSFASLTTRDLAAPPAGQQELPVAGEPTKKAARARKAKAKDDPSKPPLPFRGEDAFRFVVNADTSRRVLMPDKFSGGHAMAIESLMREDDRYAREMLWTNLGKWIAAGHAPVKGVISVGLLISCVRDWMPHVRAWWSSGQPTAPSGKVGTFEKKPPPGAIVAPTVEGSAHLRERDKYAMTAPPPPSREELECMAREAASKREDGP